MGTRKFIEKITNQFLSDVDIDSLNMLDSFQIVSLIIEIESHYSHLDILSMDITIDDFTSVESIVNVIDNANKLSSF